MAEKLSFQEAGRRGGLKSHELGKRHKWTPQEASAAGKKGLRNRWAEYRARKQEGQAHE